MTLREGPVTYDMASQHEGRELRRRFRRTEPSSSMLEHICRSTVSRRFFPLSLPSYSAAVAAISLAPARIAADELAVVAFTTVTCG